MKQEIVPQGACLLLFCVVRFSSPLKSYRHLMMYALVNAAGFRFVQMLERLSHPGKKYLVGVQFCRLSFRRLIALLISDTLNHSCRCMMASRPDIPDPQWFHTAACAMYGSPLPVSGCADLPVVVDGLPPVSRRLSTNCAECQCKSPGPGRPL